MMEIDDQSTLITLKSIPEPYKQKLLSLYRGESQLGIDGMTHKIDGITQISPNQALVLYDICSAIKPKRMIEIGLAYGFSTIALLAAIKTNGLGHLTSIDPFQSETWMDVGLTHALSLNELEAPNNRFSFLRLRSDKAALRLLDQGDLFDFIYIDGAHTFDYAFTDFFLFDQLCDINGLIVFDDMWMGSIQKVVAFIRKNRSEFVEVGTSEKNLCVFQKRGSDKRDWAHFVDF